VNRPHIKDSYPSVFVVIRFVTEEVGPEGSGHLVVKCEQVGASEASAGRRGVIGSSGLVGYTGRCPSAFSTPAV